MSPLVRYLSTAVALAAAVTAHVLWQRPLDRPSPRLPAGSAAVARPTSPPMPPTARKILDQAMALGLTRAQMGRLQALDRAWASEEDELQVAVKDAERDLAAFMKEAQGSGRATVQQIQQRSTEFSRLSAMLRERRRLHAEAALRQLDGSQRHRLAGTGPGAAFGRDR